MDKVILFGASRGGINFIENHQSQYNISAIVDNDLKKQGTTICNIPIIAPEHINLYVYDYIVVASMYVKSITEQLKNLNILEEKIKYASKNSMKVIAYPFKDKEVLNSAHQMIFALSDILKDVRHFYTFGTLLGMVRDGHLIPWDDDIDIAVFVEDAFLIKKLLLLNIKELDDIMNVKMYMRKYTNGDVASISIDCYYDESNIFNVNLDCIYVDENNAKQELNITPLYHFVEPEKFNFKKHIINVPYCYKDYLKYTYGDWQIVKENTSFNDNTLSFIEPQRSCTSEFFYDSTRGINELDDICQ